MIQAEFKKNSQNDYISFEMKGHADAGPYGYDIVCAACSALSVNAVNSLEQLANYQPIVEVSDGYLYFEVISELSSEQQGITNLLIESLVIGLQSIEDDNQKFIKVITTI